MLPLLPKYNDTESRNKLEIINLIKTKKNNYQII